MISYKPIGVFLLSIFLLLSILMLLAVTITMLAPGTPLDIVWAAKPGDYESMKSHATLIGLGFLLLAIIFVVALAGWLQRKKWGWQLVVGIFLLNGLGDLLKLFGGDWMGGLMGIIIAGLLIFYLTRKQVTSLFNKSNPPQV